jgi:hypothetical protein
MLPGPGSVPYKTQSTLYKTVPALAADDADRLFVSD